MSELVVSSRSLDEIRRHAEEEYPAECCGFLIGRAESSPVTERREVLRVVRARNAAPSARGRRYVIAPGEYRATEARLDPDQEAVIGFYHSHPDHSAEPSEVDRRHAWPWYSYLVLAVTDGVAGTLGFFSFDQDSASFRPSPWRIGSAPHETLAGA